LLGLFRPDYKRLGQFSTGLSSLGPVKSGYIRLGHVGHAKSS